MDDSLAGLKVTITAMLQVVVMVDQRMALQIKKVSLPKQPVFSDSATSGSTVVQGVVIAIIVL